MPKSTDRATRRELLTGAAAVGALAACSSAPNPSPPEKAPVWSPKISENIGDLDDSTLRWMAQLGLEWVVLQGTNWIDDAQNGYWTADQIRPLREKCRGFGMELFSLMIPLDWLMPSMLGLDDRDASIERIARSIEAGAEAGVQQFEWRWSPDFKWGADVGYYSTEGRGGATYKAFNYETVAESPPFEDLGEISRENLWERMVYFAEKVVPVAEKAGVKMTLHPKDPPVQNMRGIERILTNTEQIEAFLDAVDSPANGFTFCQGTVTEMGVDVIDAIRRIGGRGRIHHVHFRGVRGAVPQYVETFIDEGDVDMLEAMRAYRDVGFSGSLVSDHSPEVIGDFANRRIGRSYSHGYIHGLIEIVNKERSNSEAQA